MKSKRIAAIVIIVAILLTGTSFYVPNLGVAAYGNLILDDFEDGLNGWGPRGIEEEVVSLSTEQAHSGVNSLKVSNRTKTWHGATSNKTQELTLGETYVFGIWIKYLGDSYSNSQKFSLQLQYNDGVSDQYKNIKTVSVTKGNWTHLEGEFTIPTDATNVYVYLETEYKSSPTAQDFLDFYIDDFTATPAVLPEIEENIASLKDVYATYFNIGGAATANELAPAPAKALVKKHYNLLTPGNELKPDSVLDYDATIAYLEENPGDQVNPQVSIRAARTLLEYARDNNIPVRGHTLVWHAQTPDWFFKENYSTESSAEWASKEIMLQRLENYIKNLMALLKATYPTVEFYAWDVVNEAVDPNTSNGMRNPGSNSTTPGNSLWMLTVGQEYIEKAFEYARKYAPESCKLFYNDYNEYESKKSSFIYDILSDLKDKNLIDGMGMQSHWIMDYPSISMFETAARKYNSLGLELQLTELDIKQPDGSSSALASQASRYKLLMNKVVNLKKEGINFTAVIFWGVTDATSWIGGYPLLFDAGYKAKPAYYSIIEGMNPVGTITPTPTAIPTTIPTATPTIKPTLTPTVSPVPTKTPTITPTISPSPTKIPLEGVPAVTVTTTNNGNSIGQKYTVTAVRGTIDLSKVVITFTGDGMSSAAHNVWCDQAALQLTVPPYYRSLTDFISGTVNEKVLTLSISKSAELDDRGTSFVLDIRFAKTDWSDYGTITNPMVKVYYDGELVE